MLQRSMVGVSNNDSGQANRLGGNWHVCGVGGGGEGSRRDEERVEGIRASMKKRQMAGELVCTRVG